MCSHHMFSYKYIEMYMPYPNDLYRKWQLYEPKYTVPYITGTWSIMTVRWVVSHIISRITMVFSQLFYQAFHEIKYKHSGAVKPPMTFHRNDTRKDQIMIYLQNMFNGYIDHYVYPRPSHNRLIDLSTHADEASATSTDLLQIWARDYVCPTRWGHQRNTHRLTWHSFHFVFSPNNTFY